MELAEKIYKILDFKNGFFIECGANDGITQSNTFRLELLKDWTGILVEPSVEAYEKCKSARKHSKVENCALVSFSYYDDFIEGDFDGNLMASVSGSRLHRPAAKKTRARTLTSILDEYKVEKIDFFSLDTEGYELNVLQGLDFSKYAPTYVLIEVYLKEKEELDVFMISKGYDIVCNLSGYNKEEYPNWDGTHNDYLYKKIPK